MAGRHLDAAAAMWTIMKILPAVVSATVAYSQIWASSTATPSGPKTVVRQQLSKHYFTPGGLNHLGMSNYGDYLQQVATPVCAQPQSTFANFLFSLLMNSTHCSPSEAPAVTAARLPDVGLDMLSIDLLRLLLDLFQSGSSHANGRASAGIISIWILLFAARGFEAFDEFFSMIVKMSFPLSLSLTKSILVHHGCSIFGLFRLSLFDNSLDFLQRHLSLGKFSSEQEEKKHYDDLMKMAFRSPILTAVTLMDCFSKRALLRISTNEHAAIDISGYKLQVFTMMIYILTPILSSAYPRIHRDLLVFALVMVVAWKDICVYVSNRFPLPTLHTLIELPTTSSLLCSTAATIFISAIPILWRLLQRQSDRGHRQTQAHHALGRE